MNTPPAKAFSDAEAQFAASAESRIRRAFAALAVLGEAVSLILWRWPAVAGFALGAIVAFLSMAHLQRVVQAFTARVAGEGRAEPAAATVMRFLMRFVLITLLAYVVFRVSRPALYGYVMALFLPVAAMSCEAAWETWFALRRQRSS